jgi:hypothetical protein
MINKPFFSQDPEHTDRIGYTGFDGMRYVKGGWGLVLAQVLLSLFSICTTHSLLILRAHLWKLVKKFVRVFGECTTNIAPRSKHTSTRSFMHIVASHRLPSSNTKVSHPNHAINLYS